MKLIEERSEVGDKMYAYRKAHGITLREMSRRTYASELLLSMIEDEGTVTHPRIAARIAAAYELTVDDYNRIVPDMYHADELPEPTKPVEAWNGYGAYAESIRREAE